MNDKTKIAIDDIIALHQAGQLEAAKEAYLAILKKTPHDVTALHMLGILFAEQEDYLSAQDYLQKAIALKPDYLALYLHLANILKAQGLYSQAVNVLFDVIKRAPDYPAAYNNLGTLYYAQAKIEDAVSAFQIAIHKQANYVDAYYNLGLALSKLNRRQEALNAYLAAIEISPAHSGAQFQAASLLMLQANYQKAIPHWLAVIEKFPDNMEAQTNLATSYLKLGQLNEAKTHYLKALEQAPVDVQLIYNLAIIYMQQGQTDKAIEFYLRVLTKEPNLFAAHNNLGIAYLAQKKIGDALRHFREALRIQPDNEAIKHTILILEQDKNLTSSPLAYVSSLFDSYADHYDAHLMQTLDYQVPNIFFNWAERAAINLDEKLTILDLGCGTGLCGVYFKRPANYLIGVDVSQRMLDVAAEKNCYDELIQTDILNFLSKQQNQFDIILAGDVLVYFGDLTDIFLKVSRALKTHGHFLFNTEVAYQDEYQLLTSGRFAHHQKYIETLAAKNHLKILQHAILPLRKQEEKEVKGHVYLLQRENMLNF